MDSYVFLKRPWRCDGEEFVIYKFRVGDSRAWYWDIKSEKWAVCNTLKSASNWHNYLLSSENAQIIQESEAALLIS